MFFVMPMIKSLLDVVYAAASFTIVMARSFVVNWNRFGAISNGTDMAMLSAAILKAQLKRRLGAMGSGYKNAKPSHLCN